MVNTINMIIYSIHFLGSISKLKINTAPSRMNSNRQRAKPGFCYSNHLPKNENKSTTFGML